MSFENYLKTILKLFERMIPQHISRQAFYSAHFFIIVSWLAYYLRYYITSVLLFCLYLTTLLHWNKIYKISIIKIIDIIVVLLVLTRITFYDSYQYEKYRILWIYSICTSIIMFLINEVTFYIFLPKATEREKEFIYYRSTYVHMFFLHFLPTTTCAYCAIMSVGN